MRLTREELLVLLIEECGEVVQAATKCLRFGYDVDHGTGYGNNRDALAKELGELTAVRDELLIDTYPKFGEGWRDKIKRAEAAKEKYGVVQQEPRKGQLADRMQSGGPGEVEKG